MSKYTTGEMAKLCNVSVRTVQFYDTRGLLHPSELTEGGRRLYTDDDLTKLRLICTLKIIGLSLDSIKGILESKSSGKVLSLLLDEQMKLLSDEIEERRNQLETIKTIRDYVSNSATIPVNTIGDIEHMMENNKKVRSRFRRLVVNACIISIPQYSFLAWWIFGGPWLPFVICFLVNIPIGILLAKHYFKDAAFICAECNSVFKPAFKDVLRTSGTIKARWLTCTECGHAGYCVEVYAKNEAADPI
ncbi:MAG: MerR family transcriptional regulator [Oscillospiraceae bacterium]|nr:MerR family transcriptional regulator [Oscillospiraceae bacterium]